MDKKRRLSTLDEMVKEIPRLRRFARYLTKDNNRADDLVQDCLVRAIDNIDKWQPGTNLRAWMFVILKNIFRNDLRTLTRERPSDNIEESEVLAIPAAQDTRMAFLELKKNFMSLSTEHREILLLVAIEGFTYEEAADILGVPIGTIRSRLSRARNALRELQTQKYKQAEEAQLAGRKKSNRD